MTNQQRLRDALSAAVPEPPTDPWRGRAARARSHGRRRRAVGAGIAAALAVAIAVPVVRALTTTDRTQTLDVVTTGSGRTACRQLEHHHGLGFLADSKVIDPGVATRWSALLKGTSDVTVCVLFQKSNGSSIVAIQDHHSTVVARGDYGHVAGVMERLGSLQATEPASTTEAPFACPQIESDNVTLPGSATLPLGATGVRICDSIVGGPIQPLTSGVDDLVRAVNSQPLTYWRGSNCSGDPSSWGYTLVFDYPTGTRVVAGDLCGWLGVGPVQRREASPTIGEQFLSALRTQEQAEPQTQPAACPGSVSSPQGPGDVTRIVAARFCPAAATGQGVLLSSSQLTTLKRATVRYEEWTSSGPEHPCPTPPEGLPHLMLSDAWHQQFSVSLGCRNLQLWGIRFTDSGPDAVRPVEMRGVKQLLSELQRDAG